ncbi:Smr/MutS family protein [Hyphomicrobium sp.]|uniref:Smr/MutS family protein n=1 Tax=Hyphomicrobium sp. TaxID=82 RepID=UPI003F70E468
MSKPPSKPRRRHLSKEDEALWEHTASSLQPLKVRKDRHLADMPDLDSISPFLTDGKAAKAMPSKPAAKPLPTPPRASETTAPSLSTFDRKAARKLRQGHFEIEARIDLHGMRQHEAHGALRSFLHSAFRKGQRWVLVITGKGGPRRPRDDDDMFGVAERGVLKKNVPMWLSEPELRAIVVSFTSAAISHGGEGALYVQLRNPEKVR